MAYAYINILDILACWRLLPHVEVTGRAAELTGNGYNKRVYEIRYTEDGKNKIRFVTRYYKFGDNKLVYHEEEEIKRKFQKRLIKKQYEQSKK